MGSLHDYDLEVDESPTEDFATAGLHDDSTKVPTLTLVAHPDIRRIGQQASLRPLLLRRPVVLSRSKLAFTPTDSRDPGTPLLDTSVSRTPLVWHAGHEPGSIVLDSGGVTIKVDDGAVSSSHLISRERLLRGVLVGLSARVGLYLHSKASSARFSDEHGLLGDSDAICSLRATIDEVATSRAPVLILGENGTGKELVAAAIHRRSGRAHGPFIAVNSASLTEGTALSQLFGHRKGAFTGADQRHAGLFEQARGGSLFLDEIGDASPAVQVMLLRALESNTVLALGDDKEHHVDVRVLAATELDLGQEMGSGRFRPSLAQRLASIVIHVPPVRSRREDIPSLLLHFLSLIAHGNPGEGGSETLRRKGFVLSTAFMFGLLAHHFPGNVREIRNIAQQLWSVGHTRNHLAFATAPVRTTDLGAAEPGLSRPRFTRDEVLKALHDSNWSPAKAARLLGIPNSTIHYWMTRQGIGRRAVDLSDPELQAVAERCGGEINAMSRMLAVSPRGIRLRLARIQRNNAHNALTESLE